MKFIVNFTKTSPHIRNHDSWGRKYFLGIFYQKNLKFLVFMYKILVDFNCFAKKIVTLYFEGVTLSISPRGWGGRNCFIWFLYFWDLYTDFGLNISTWTVLCLRAEPQQWDSCAVDKKSSEIIRDVNSQNSKCIYASEFGPNGAQFDYLIFSLDHNKM